MSDLAIIPAPREVKRLAGSFTLTGATAVIAQDSRAARAAGWLREFLRPIAGEGDRRDGTADIVFVTDDCVATEEGYVLEIGPSGIEIRSNGASGAFYATQTLRQLLPDGLEADSPGDGDIVLPAVRIADSPAFPYRGAHLDVSRHFFSVAFVKRYLDWMALHKLNTFHWHLTDDQGWRIEIDAYPRLTSVGAWRDETVVGHTLGRGAHGDGTPHGGYYTKSDVADVVEYAAARGITIIPEIDMPGHSSALLAAYPEFGCLDDGYEVATRFGIFRNILCPSDETFAMIESVLNEVAAMFPGPYIHIGGDEVDTTHWRGGPLCQLVMTENGIEDADELLGYFIRRLQKIVADRGKRLVGWDDILDQELDGEATVVAWRGEEHAAAAAVDGHDVIAAWGAFYFDRFQSRSLDEPLAIHGIGTLREVYENSIMPPDLEPDCRERVLGAQCCLWTEYVGSESEAEYMVLPRMSAFAERVWSQDTARDYDDFVARLEALFGRFDTLGLNASHSVWKPEARTSLTGAGHLRVSLRADGEHTVIHYTLDGSAPSVASPVYDGPLELTGASVLRATSRRGDRLFGDTRVEFDPHFALGCEVRFASEPETIWPGGPAATIMDGQLRRNGFFLHSDWAGFNSTGMDATIDLATETRISRVELGFDTRFHRKLFAPTSIEVFVPDGDGWRSIARLDRDGVRTDENAATVEFSPVATSSVRVVCGNDRRVFSHETGGKEPVSIYIDQIAIR